MKCFNIALLFLCVSVIPAQAQNSSELDRTTDPAWLDSLYHTGIEFGQFLDEADARRDRWVNNFGDGSLHADLAQRVSNLSGTWYLLAVAIDGCSDSVSTIPFLAHLSGASRHVNMRVVDPDAGRAIMEAHRTPDGRAATPTVLVLNERFEPVGAFIERPDELQEWAQGEGADLSRGAFAEQKFAWYDEDAGRQTISAVLDIMEADRVE